MQEVLGRVVDDGEKRRTSAAHLGGTALNRLESSIECMNVLIYLLYINNRSNIFRTWNFGHLR